MKTRPQLIFIAEANGAGKSTFSKNLSSAGAINFDPDKEQTLKYPITFQKVLEMHFNSIFRIV